MIALTAEPRDPKGYNNRLGTYYTIDYYIGYGPPTRHRNITPSVRLTRVVGKAVPVNERMGVARDLRHLMVRYTKQEVKNTLPTQPDSSFLQPQQQLLLSSATPKPRRDHNTITTSSRQQHNNTLLHTSSLYPIPHHLRPSPSEIILLDESNDR